MFHRDNFSEFDMFFRNIQSNCMYNFREFPGAVSKASNRLRSVPVYAGLNYLKVSGFSIAMQYAFLI